MAQPRLLLLRPSTNTPSPSLLTAHLLRGALLSVVDLDDMLSENVVEARHGNLHLRQSAGDAFRRLRRLVRPAPGGEGFADPPVAR